MTTLSITNLEQIDREAPWRLGAAIDVTSLVSFLGQPVAIDSSLESTLGLLFRI